MYGIYDKDKEDERQKKLKSGPPDAKIDLHGLNRYQAWDKLEEFFENSIKKGYEKLLIIHGKGDNCQGDCVLKKVTQKFIEKHPYTEESWHPDAKHGGTGATYVIFKKIDSQD